MKILQSGGMWDGTLLFFSADNGGWASESGSNNCASSLPPAVFCPPACRCFWFLFGVLEQ